jgi:predicted dehydrogenase
VVQSNFNVPDAAAKWRLEFFGEQGRLLGENVIGQVDGGTLDAMYLEKQGEYNAQQDTNEATAESEDVAFGNMYAREIESFCSSLLNGTTLEVPARDAVYIQRVMEAAYESEESGCLKGV